MISPRHAVTLQEGPFRTRTHTSQEHVRLIVELGTVQGRTLHQCALRPDGRQLRLLFDKEELLQISASIGEDGNARLELDLLHVPGLNGLASTRRPPR
jgi:hypothetical protein